ncbi:non-ribosomal peptide synthetase-like protein [Sinomonas atrocyanea]|uniref:Pls/PosA family non-ribosomal peptide synthetase n=1 Tax=Sinomonas atrocyanea TaxID=37927 RepID=UPI0027855F82|nr:Pls/PosA family non-ribosomal peptide synthetase [Sinomonas atrocyanea]MDP9884171.1 non-ribosomal peptide synthetase-like protein [Sinomonas atrocyanea]
MPKHLATREAPSRPASENGRPDSLLAASGDDGIRWHPGERLETLFEEACDRLRDAGHGDRLAVDAGGFTLTYDELDAWTNRLARRLRARGVRAGDRLALLFDQPVFTYAAMLAVLKAHAAYVPLDVAFPPERISYIMDDAGVATLLSLSHLRDVVPDGTARALYLDDEEATLGSESPLRLSADERGPEQDQLAYIIYTSGSTGRPKGVAVEHASICNFVRVAAGVYGIRPDDRVYQGMTTAFDFSVEEIWVPWMSGATLVPKDGSTSLVGIELAEFLQRRAVTALCCVPTLLSTLEDDVPGLRFLLVSGEACPPDLVERWHRPERRFLNVYGPTEATVTATWSVVDPHRPPTLGTPLPTYAAVILDVENDSTVGAGELGEIGLAGIGLARGYVNRPDLTQKAFIPDFLDLPDNPSHRIYRTGDLGRINADGEIEYHGRIDSQVKVHGYRIELAEIESVILQIPGVAQAAVVTHEPSPGVVELAAYYSRRRDGGGVERAVVREHLRRALPAYMRPAFLQELEAFPLLPSDKVDRRRLPAPGRRGGDDAATAPAPPATDREAKLARALAEALGEPAVSVEADFFADLGASSITMAHFCAIVRKDPDLVPVSMKDTYLHPTIRSLAAAAPAAPPAAAAVTSEKPTTPERASTFQYVLCGALQALTYVLGAFLAGFAMATGFQYLGAATDPLDGWLRATLFGAVVYAGLCVLPVAVKWLVVGRWRPTEFPVWSLRYFRFWLVRAVLRTSPMRLLAGSPLYVLYLRALGARIGRGATVFTTEVPVCTDLLSVGAGTVVRKDASLSCYRALGGMIQTGAVTVGEGAVISEATVLDIGARVGDRAQLGHASALYAGQAIPDRQSWHGSPAQPCAVDYSGAPPAPCGTGRRFFYGVWNLLFTVLLVIPFGTSVFAGLVPLVVAAAGVDTGNAAYYLRLAGIAATVLGALIVVLLLGITLIPRALNLLLRPGRVYPLYGFHYGLHRTIGRLTNLKFLIQLTGDSSLIPHYLRLIGYRMPELVQTGSNFGMEVKHESPFACTVGSGTMVADGLSVMSAQFSSSSFQITPVSIGRRSFLGNGILYPPDARTGENCLIATKAMVPLDGAVREDVGLLGSPSFEIPRSVQSDAAFDELKSGPAFKSALRAKNRHNAVTILLFLLAREGFTFATLLIGTFALTIDPAQAVLTATGAVLALFLFTTCYYTVIECAARGFRRLVPKFCSIYQRPFWRHERFWKLSNDPYAALLNGTPFKGFLWRTRGLNVGRRLFDDGAGIPEKTTVTIGDDCMLNARCVIQCHSMEDGTFKLADTVIGSGCTLGVKAFVHYGVNLGDGTAVEPDSFVMKGEEVPAGMRFGGNPAQQLPALPQPLRSGADGGRWS